MLTRRFRTLTAIALGIWALAATTAAQAPAGVAYQVRDLRSHMVLGQSGGDVIDTPVLPGSVIKMVTLTAALESGAIDPSFTHFCRRRITVDGVTYVCSHPDLKRPMTAAEALAHSCNDFFISLAPRLSHEAVNRLRSRLGLTPISASAPFARTLIGLDGPRITPRQLADIMARLVGAPGAPALPLRDSTRQVLREGLRGAADYGTASALHAGAISALAKTGTAGMPGGGSMGLLVALVPATAPARSIVVVAPGAAGLDAAALAVDLLAQPERARQSGRTPDAVTGRAERLVRVGVTDAGGRVRVESIGLNEYVARVLAGEGQPDAADAALEALAITARTYAITNAGRHQAEGFDMCDTTHCQVVRAATARTRRLAASTSGRILLENGRPAVVFHSAWCGGRPEKASEVWPGTVDDADVGATDDACGSEPGWSADLRVAELERAFVAAGMRGTRLRELRVLQRNRTGRVSRIGVPGWSPAELSGQEFRTIVGRTLGWQHVKSTLFDLQSTSTGYRVSGHGFGHGVGLCVLGAGRRAARGATVDQILAVYFPGLSVGNSPLTTDLSLALPGQDEAERSALLALVRRARDDIVATAGVSPPTHLRVTVHPTVESFSRASGQPWFVAGSTRGAIIDLLPLTTLRRNGRLERVVRHEVAHAVLDSSLADRPLWVREGAASYFATPSTPESRVAPACPADAELRRPGSPAAQQEAYARADACFRRAMAGGRAWHDVR